jgi:hypothetical protein
MDPAPSRPLGAGGPSLQSVQEHRRAVTVWSGSLLAAALVVAGLAHHVTWLFVLTLLVAVLFFIVLLASGVPDLNGWLRRRTRPEKSSLVELQTGAGAGLYRKVATHNRSFRIFGHPDLSHLSACRRAGGQRKRNSPPDGPPFAGREGAHRVATSVLAQEQPRAVMLTLERWEPCSSRPARKGT